MTSQNQQSALLELPPKLRIYVKCRLDGMTQLASAKAAGSNNARVDSHRWEHKEEVQQAMIAATNAIAEEVGFSRKEAHDLLLSAYHSAETATEQVNAVREMINLHGIAKPKVIEHKHDHQHTHELEFLPTNELMKLAKMEDLTLEGEFEVISEEPAQLTEEVKDDNGPGYDKETPL